MSLLREETVRMVWSLVYGAATTMMVAHPLGRGSVYGILCD